jgi:hypothetical protein
MAVMSCYGSPPQSQIAGIELETNGSLSRFPPIGSSRTCSGATSKTSARFDASSRQRCICCEWLNTRCRAIGETRSVVLDDKT